MAFSNNDAGAVFDEIADLLEVQGGNAFRVRAYRNAARTLRDLPREAGEMLNAGERLDALPGIGKDLAVKISEIMATGTCGQLEALRKVIPHGVIELLRLPGVGPRRVQALHQSLGIESLDQLRVAAQQGRVRAVRGFSAAGEQRLLEATVARLQSEPRMPLALAGPVADELVQDLLAMPGVEQAVAAGSLRRRRDTVGDLDLLVTTTPDSPVMERFPRHPRVRDVLARGNTRASVVLRNGLQVDLRAVPGESFGAAWLYFTGSRAHNIALRRIAQEAGLKLNEYGLFRGTHRIAGADEKAVYAALELAWIPPELREDRGEIDAAAGGSLPGLVALSDLRGDLHAHTSDSDGRDSLEEMARAAANLGRRYLAITDHSPRVGIVHGLTAARLARQVDEIDALNERLRGIRLLKGVEVDILPNGQLDLPDSVLGRLDLVVGAVHEALDLPAPRQSDRLLRAMDHRYFSILAHPTGRLFDERASSALDLERVLRHARARGCFVELNAQPMRLDLDDRACRMARDAGVLVSIASDAHSGLELANLRWGIGQARRGWLEPRHVLNARPLSELLPLLGATMGRGMHALAAWEPGRVDPAQAARRRRVEQSCDIAGDRMDSMLVVCYSETGVARQVARQLCAEHGWPLGEVQDLRDQAPESHPVREVVDSLLLRRAPILYEGPAPGDFRTVVLVTGMKAGQLPASMRTFLLDHRDVLRRVAVLSILKTEDTTSAVAEVAQLLAHAPIHNASVSAPEVFDGSAAAGVTAFGEVLQPRSTATQVPPVAA